MDEHGKAEVGRAFRNVLATFVGRQTIAVGELMVLSILRTTWRELTIEELQDIASRLIEVGLIRQVSTFGWEATSSTQYSAIGATDPWLGWQAV